MTDSGVLPLPLPDRAARDRISRDLDTNLLVEAGAGSGKTTELVSRMTALVTSGQAKIEQIAAVTFTRKAAGELRQRFQIRLEAELRAAHADPEADSLAVERLRVAVDGIDRAFIGTIHSFCARLLRERPLEIGLDPAFQELPVEEREELRRRYWDSYLERLTRDSDPILEELASAGIRPTVLRRAFEHLVDNPDVEFPVEATAAPTSAQLADVRSELEGIVDAGWELMPERQPEPDWDSLQKKIRTLHFTRDVTGWKEPADVFDALAALCRKRGHRITQKRWRQAALAKAFKERVDAFGVGDTHARRLLDQWYAHRYGLAIRLARHGAQEFAAYRLRSGRLDFQDLLLLAARLLRRFSDVRRHLGERYRFLLVDEFQDTDPLQAEIALLLASEPSDTETNGGASSENGGGQAGGDGVRSDWRTAVPRPGALFVVGDPKQSIYRFRRADIQLYNLVKQRFDEFGAVVELTTNFRSRPAIGDLVNEHFASPDFFPETANERQAAFEPLNTRPATSPVAAEGVFVYDIEPGSSNQASVAEDDGSRIATWIRDRIDSGERAPGDFMILTRRRGLLATYARALESWDIPVQVTGAGVRAEEELAELEAVLECMIDPANPVKVLAVLVGLFFGVDYEQLVEHRLGGGSLDVTRPREHGHPEVIEALSTIRRWWKDSVAKPADVFVAALVDELGLLPYAAAGELGSLRAGALLYGLDAIRAAALGGDASLPGALGALRSALSLAEAEAPLEPGRQDVARLMNLHQAKGLEANVVVLADPSRSKDRAPELHTVRAEDGSARGYVRVAESRSGFGGDQTVAAPVGWDGKERSALAFETAEEVRLLYVAVTRAREELVVSRWPTGKGASPWAALDPWLDARATRLELERRAPGTRRGVELTADEARRRSRAAAERLQDMARSTFEFVSVTELAKQNESEGEAAAAATTDAGGVSYKGLSWGSAVHGALAAASRPNVTEEGLHATCRDLLVEYGRPLDDHGEPIELTELRDMVRAVTGSKLWSRARAAEQRLVEIPFAAPGVTVSGADLERAAQIDPSDGPPQLDLFSSTSAAAAPLSVAAEGELDGGTIRVLEGVIDLAFRESDGWVIADYKTDAGTDPLFADRARAYRRQVELYAEAWSELTGDRVKERVLFYTTQGRIEQW